MIPKACVGCPNQSQFATDGYCKLDGEDEVCPVRRLRGSPWVKFYGMYGVKQ